MSGLRIALLDHTEGAYPRQLATGLRAAGHEPRLVAPASIPVLEALLKRRGFTPALSHLPRALVELVHGGYDLAHAFSAPDAAVALAWRRASGCPVLFTCTETLDRPTLADGRLRLSTLARAIEMSDAVIAASDEVRTAVERWFARSPAVIAADDAGAYERLYRAQLQKTGVSA